MVCPLKSGSVVAVRRRFAASIRIQWRPCRHAASCAAGPCDVSPVSSINACGSWYDAPFTTRARSRRLVAVSCIDGSEVDRQCARVDHPVATNTPPSSDDQNQHDRDHCPASRATGRPSRIVGRQRRVGTSPTAPAWHAIARSGTVQLGRVSRSRRTGELSAHGTVQTLAPVERQRRIVRGPRAMSMVASIAPVSTTSARAARHRADRGTGPGGWRAPAARPRRGSPAACTRPRGGRCRWACRAFRRRQ